MKKRLITLLTPLLLLLVAFIPQTAQASTSKASVHSIPFSYDCINSHCNGTVQWYGQIHGAHNKMTISNPTLNYGNADFQREMGVTNSIPNLKSFRIGFEKFLNNAAVCNGYTPGPLYFYYVSYYNGGNVEYRKCQAVPSGDFNKDVDFRIGYFVSNGGGVFVQIQGPSGNELCHSACFFGGWDQTQQDILYLEDILDTVSGNQVWGGHWIDNQYQTVTNGGWGYQKSPSAGCIPGRTNGCPLSLGRDLIYFNVYPNKSSTGGEVYSCVYETGSFCHFGS